LTRGQLPPDEQLFFELIDLLRNLALKFNELNLVAAVTENEQVIDRLKYVRKMAVDEPPPSTAHVLKSQHAWVIDRIYDGVGTAE
jgi:hypothetical protein